MSEMKNNLSIENVTKIEEFIQNLGREELMFLNKLVVGRLRLLNQLETTKSMTEFMVGETVEFDDNRGNRISGRIMKMNKKTISIISKDNIQWNVHPSFLRKI